MVNASRKDRIHVHLAVPASQGINSYKTELNSKNNIISVVNETKKPPEGGFFVSEFRFCGFRRRVCRQASERTQVPIRAQCALHTQLYRLRSMYPPSGH